LGVLLVLVLAFAGFLGWLTMTEYTPAPIESLEPIMREAEGAIPEGATLNILSWNIGYGGLGAGSDFFMDGGESARSADEKTVNRYLSGIDTITHSKDYDLVMLQEVDTDADRTYGIDEAEQLAYGTAYHALNFSCPYVPNPKTLFYNAIGKVNSGLLTISNFEVDKAERISLPCPFSWPLRIANLKRCLLVTRTPVDGTDRELVLVNLHLEAYDDGEGKLAQTKQLLEFLSGESEKGNYVIAGGDWNQIFPDSLNAYPNTHTELWTPGYLNSGDLAADWSYVWDASHPTCRLLNQPYNPADSAGTQYYVIDGFLVSPNLEVSAVETVDQGFAFSDHNPVLLTVSLGE
jgi:endonuclease/exonuclease/phosphatase family metal-dependent hydrolase